VTSVRTATLPRRTDSQDPAAAAQLSLPRIYLMRVGYLIMAAGLAVVKWPAIVHHAQWTLMEGVVNCMLVALSVLAFLGLRYPVQLLPVLLFESAWKLIWLAVVALPLWSAHHLDPATREVASQCLLVVIILAVIPWRYVYAQYFTQRGERWRPDPALRAGARP
jgi:hypothetical protein